jgi:endonuclease III
MPPRPVSRNPFHLILWEQVAYLKPDAQRRAAFLTLRKDVGLEAMDILGAPRSTLERIARIGGGIAADRRAARMHESAELVVGKWDGDLGKALRLPEKESRRALGEFPMIGEPGADKILAITGRARVLPMDSNALRVVRRLGFVAELKDYRSTYRRAREVLAPALPDTGAEIVSAGALLRLHGQELCRRSAPRCAGCPLRAQCPSAGRPMHDRW